VRAVRAVEGGSVDVALPPPETNPLYEKAPNAALLFYLSSPSGAGVRRFGKVPSTALTALTPQMSSSGPYFREGSFLREGT